MTHEDLIRLLHYDPATGIFTWKINRGRLAKAGQIAGTLHHSSYITLRVCGKYFAAHRLAWFYVNAAWPVGEIDHKNGVRSDNRISNLHDVSRNDNMHNQEHGHSQNRTGILGVTWYSRLNKFRARIRVNGKLLELGYFPNTTDASAAYLAAKRRLHQNSPRLLGDFA